MSVPSFFRCRQTPACDSPPSRLASRRGMKVTILALTLNEIDGVKAILPAIDRSWYQQLLVVDGGSTDGTIEWCRANGYEVVVQKRRGIRYAEAYQRVYPQVTDTLA